MTGKTSQLALAIAGLLMMAGSAMAQSTATATSTANATVVAPIAITAVNSLEFGKLIPSNYTATIGLDNTRSDSVANNYAKGTLQTATFTVTGEPSFTYVIALPVSALIATPSGTVKTMTVDAFTVGAGAKGTVLSSIGTLDGSGNGDLNVGAKVNTSQAPGAYTGTYPVTVTYN